MAFCIRSERKMDYFKKDVINPGPGEYFQEKEAKKKKSRIHPPFHTSGKRSTIIQKEEIPGPGSYDLIDKSYNGSCNINNNNNSNKKEENNNNNIIRNKNDKTYNNISTFRKNNKSSFYYNTINNNSFSNFADASTNPLYKNNKSFSDFDNSSNSSKIGFLSQAIRFNDKDKRINEPGPGTYETIDHIVEQIKNNNKKKNKFESKLMKASLKVDAGSLNRIVSIPSKIMNGYSIERKNKTAKNNCFSNAKNECKLIIDKFSNYGKNMPTSEYVGPGSYDIYIKEKGNCVLNWSKGFNIKEINSKKELLKTQKVFEEMKRYGDKISNENRNKRINIINLCKSNSAHYIVGKYKKGLNDLNKKALESNVNKKKENFYYCRDSFIQDKKEIPGPGYYSKELINKEKDTLYYKEKEKEKIEQQKIINKKSAMSSFRRVIFGEETKTDSKFGSNCERFLSKSKSMGNIGPTTYFIQKNKYEPNKKIDILSHLKTGKLVNSFENRDFLKNKKSNLNAEKKQENNKSKTKNNSFNNTFLNKSLIDNPGPGEYEISHNFIIPSFSQISLMNSSVERFPDVIQNTPGPGSYIYNENIENEKIEQKIKTIINFGNQQIEEKMRRIEEIKKFNKTKNDFPGAGTYNPGLQDTINCKMKSRINPKQSYQSPFLISSERFKHLKDEGISPAVYDPYKYDKKQNNLQYMVFGKAKRFVSNYNDENMKGVWHLAGPGSYDIKDSWNKKTYNKLFSGNQ